MPETRQRRDSSSEEALLSTCSCNDAEMGLANS